MDQSLAAAVCMQNVLGQDINMKLILSECKCYLYIKYFLYKSCCIRCFEQSIKFFYTHTQSVVFLID